MWRRALAAITLAAGGLAVVTSSGDGAHRPRLILLLTVDTLRADRLGAYGSPLGLTPALDGLAARSQVFTNAFAPAPLTLPSVAAMLTSRYPEELGMMHNSAVAPRQVPRLPGVLRDRGWATGAVVSNYVLRRRAGLARGFLHYDAQLNQREGQRAVRERRGADTTRAALAMVDTLAPGRKPVFLWVHYQDPHGPYVPPDALRRRTLAREIAAPDGLRELPLSTGQGGEGALPRYQEVAGHRQVGFYRAGYNGEVALVDEEIGRLFAGLEQRTLLRDAVVLFAADHGESLGEEGHWFAHGERVGPELVRVPLMMRVPGMAAARRDALASLLDVFPTLAALAGADVPPSLRGRDLLSAAPAPLALYFSTLATARVPRHGIATADLQYVRWEDADGAHERVYRRGEAAGASEEPEPHTARLLRGRLTQQRAAIEPGAPERADPLGQEEIEHLSALGYVAPGDGPR